VNYKVYLLDVGGHRFFTKWELEKNLANLQLLGRNGMHQDNNQDHPMMTGLCAARSILGAEHNLWAIDTEPDYQEEQQGW
jgi:hypothetical protein